MAVTNQRYEMLIFPVSKFFVQISHIHLRGLYSRATRYNRLKNSRNSFQVLYMDAVQHSPEDIQDIVDLMTEKEIRLHALLEEIELLLQE